MKQTRKDQLKILGIDLFAVIITAALVAWLLYVVRTKFFSVATYYDVLTHMNDFFVGESVTANKKMALIEELGKMALETKTLFFESIANFLAIMVCWVGMLGTLKYKAWALALGIKASKKGALRFIAKKYLWIAGWVSLFWIMFFTAQGPLHLTLTMIGTVLFTYFSIGWYAQIAKERTLKQTFHDLYRNTLRRPLHWILVFFTSLIVVYILASLTAMLHIAFSEMMAYIPIILFIAYLSLIKIWVAHIMKKQVSRK
ncbi:MAG: hypothetical protein O2779_05090 [Nanoarchaeota archaeon]|nr:hypothetical protein [Nanoarchaeota archaeon]